MVGCLSRLLQVYPDAETMVQDEDTQPLSQPIVAPVKPKLFSVLEKEVPATAVSVAGLCASWRANELLHVLLSNYVLFVPFLFGRRWVRCTRRRLCS